MKNSQETGPEGKKDLRGGRGVGRKTGGRGLLPYMAPEYRDGRGRAHDQQYNIQLSAI